MPVGEVSMLDKIVAALVAGFTTATNGALSAIEGILPQAMIITGVMLAISICYRAYKKVAK